MYKLSNKSAILFFDFNQPAGMHMNPENRWIILAESIPWDDLELMYADLFKSKTGNVAKPFRMALGALIVNLLHRLLRIHTFSTSLGFRDIRKHSRLMPLRLYCSESA